MNGKHCSSIHAILAEACARFGWDAFVYTFSIAEDWTSAQGRYVQEFSSAMHSFLATYERLGLSNNLHRLELVRSDLPRTFETSRVRATAADRQIADLLRQAGWGHGLAAPHYGYGGALGLTVLVATGAEPVASQIQETLAFLLPRQAQMNAWARDALQDDPGELLSPREIECLMLVANGRTSKHIAEDLSIGVRTVEFHIQNAMHKLGVTSRSQAASRLIQLAPRALAIDGRRPGDSPASTTVRLF